MQTCANLKYYYTIIVTILRSRNPPLTLVFGYTHAKYPFKYCQHFYVCILTKQDQNSFNKLTSFATFLQTRVWNWTNVIIKSINIK